MALVLPKVGHDLGDDDAAPGGLLAGHLAQGFGVAIRHGGELGRQAAAAPLGKRLRNSPASWAGITM